MNWKDRYRQASFRGVQFFVTAQETEIGRNVVIHEYPNRSLPYGEDLGRKARNFKIEAYILGDDYDLARNALFDAIEAEGPGELIHPNFGTLNVICKPSSVSETSEKTRIAKFTLNFVEVGEKRYPDSSIDHLSQIDQSINQVQEVALKNFEDNFSVQGVQQYIKDDALNLFEKATQKIEVITGSINQAEENAANTASKLDKFKRDIFSLISSPGKAAKRFSSTLNLLDSSTDYKRLFSGFKSYYKFEDEVSKNASRPSRAQQILERNQDAIVTLVKVSALSISIKAGARASRPTGIDVSTTDGFDSINEAINSRNELIEVIDSILDVTNNDELFLALSKLRNEARNSIPDESTRLHHLKVFTPSFTTNSLVLAHDLYGDASKESEITKRNKIIHPGFIPAGSSLEVLADA